MFINQEANVNNYNEEALQLQLTPTTHSTTRKQCRTFDGAAHAHEAMKQAERMSTQCEKCWLRPSLSICTSAMHERHGSYETAATLRDSFRSQCMLENIAIRRCDMDKGNHNSIFIEKCLQFEQVLDTHLCVMPWGLENNHCTALALNYFNRYIHACSTPGSTHTTLDVFKVDILARVFVFLALGVSSPNHTMENTLGEMIVFCPNPYSIKLSHLIRVQKHVLKILQFDILRTSPFEFLKIYLLSKKKIRLEKNGMFAFNGTDKNMNACNFYATYFAELALHSTLVFKPSIVAAACLSLAHRTCNIVPIWHPKLQALTNISSSDLYKCERQLLQLHQLSYKTNCFVYQRYCTEVTCNIAVNRPLNAI